MDRKESGFTLIELIVSLVLMGVMGAMAGMAVVTSIKGYVFSRDNAAMSEKAQLALARINRELLELSEVSSAQASRVTYQRLSGDNTVTLTIYLSGDRIKIASGGSASGGDDLVDGVSSLTFSYFKGASPWIGGSDDINLLSSVQVSLALARSDGSASVTFTTTASPRNNQNTGGVPPTTDPPAKISYCFVATAAYGDPNHPVVQLLRQFRDRFLLTWRGGEAMVACYYELGPYAARAIVDRPWARGLARLLLLPFAAFALILLYCPAKVAALVVISWLIGCTALLRSRGGRPRIVGNPARQGGSALIATIIVITILSALAAALLPLGVLSTANQIGGANSLRSYFLAESGYRYAGSEYLNAGTEAAKDGKLESLHTRIFTLNNNDGKFQLYIYPYFYKTTADPVGTAVLQAKVTGGFPPGLSLSSGYLKVNGTVHQYSGSSHNGSNVTFTRAGGAWPSIPVGSVVVPVGRPNGTQTVTNSTHNYIDLETSTGSANAFPVHNCTFKLESASAIYTYKKRTGNRLEGIKLSDAPGSNFSVSVNSGTNVVLEKFIKMRSIGTYSSGNNLQTTREITYHVPIGYAVSGTSSKVTYHDTFDSLSHWFLGSSQGELGGHEIVGVGGDNALHVTSAATTNPFSDTGQWSILQFNWSGTNADLNAAWASAGHLLSYDLQVKVKATNSPYFMAGMNFRDQSAGSDFYCYGISYMKARQTRLTWPGTGSWFDADDIPSDIIPPALFTDPMEVGGNYWIWFTRWQDRYSQPAIVLWQRTSAGFKWLAYKLLTTSDQVIISSGGWPRLADWSNLQVRVIEAYPLGFTNGGTAPLLYGENITGQTSLATAMVNGSPILSSGGWASGNAAGKLTLSNVVGSFSGGEGLLVDGVVRARAQGSLGSRKNYIRAYYGDTSAHGTANAVATDNNRLGNPRVTSSSTTVHWPVDDIASWAADNDYLTLVQWNNDLNTSVTRLGTGAELNAVIEDSALTTPTSGTFSRSEVGLDTAGGSSSNIYFDDFAIQVAGSSGNSTGFLAPIQQ